MGSVVWSSRSCSPAWPQVPSLGTLSVPSRTGGTPMRRRIMAALVLTSVLGWSAGALAATATDFTIRVVVTATNTGTEPSRHVLLRLPLPSGTAYHASIAETLDVQPSSWEVDASGHRFGLFEGNLEPGQSLTFTYTKRSSGPVVEQAGAREETMLWRYLQAAPRLQVHHPVVTGLAQQFSAYPEALARARAIFVRVRETIVFDLDAPYRNSTAVDALTSGRGVCEDFALAYVALARASGIPSRVVYGYYFRHRRMVGEKHAWAESFIGGVWVRVDPSRAGWDGFDAGRYVVTGYDNPPLTGWYEGGKLAVSMTITALRVRQWRRPVGQ
ncbi:MAG TPA: hypothetical protein DCM14_01840 [Clostridiales bacterium UBA8153]|nr:hypothetical protein [Clostridiales bacterium UBA8153]